MHQFNVWTAAYDGGSRFIERWMEFG